MKTKQKTSNLLSFLYCNVLCLNYCAMNHLMHFYFINFISYNFVFIGIIHGKPLHPSTPPNFLANTSTLKTNVAPKIIFEIF